MVDALTSLPDIWGSVFVEEVGGLHALERRYPRAYAIVRDRMIARGGRALFDALYKHDVQIFELIHNSASIVRRMEELERAYSDAGRSAARDWLAQARPPYEFDYTTAVVKFAEFGPSMVAVYGLLATDPAATVMELHREAENRQTEYDRRVEVGERAVGREIASREVALWPDDSVTLAELLEPREGFDTHDEALVMATISGVACAVTKAEGRFYLYRLNEQYSLSDVLATSFERRTELLRRGRDRGIVIVTTDGVVLTYHEDRYFAEQQTERAEENLAAKTQVLEKTGERLSYADGFLLFREMVRDLVLANLAAARRELRLHRGRLFGPSGIPSSFTIDRAAGEQLQRDTAALRRHLMYAADLASRMGDSPSPDQMADTTETLAAIGRIHRDNPTAALMVLDRRDDDETGPAKEGDFEDRVAGLLPGDAVSVAARELKRRLDNIERVENHLLHKAGAALDLTPLHDEVLRRFPPDHQSSIRRQLVLRDISNFASSVGIAVGELGLLVIGMAVGGPLGLLASGASMAMGAKQAAESFEHASLLQAMTELDIHGELALATPEQATSARRWAWVSVGLTLLDAGQFVRSANEMARLRMVLQSPDLNDVLTYSRRSFRDAAQALGKTDRQLLRELQSLRGQARTRFLSELRVAVESRISGGRRGFFGFPPEMKTKQLHEMRRALLADTADIDKVVASITRFGMPIDRKTVDLIKRYAFDSPGLNFAKENYETWTRLSAGRGTIDDARYIVHEAAEIAEFQRKRFPFLAKNWGKMGQREKEDWLEAFEGTPRQPVGAYIAAHRVALAAEFDFVAEQVYRFSGRRFSREVIAAVDVSPAGREAMTYMKVGNHVLRDHPSFGSWQRQANDPVLLDAAARARLGRAVYDGTLEAKSPGNAAYQGPSAAKNRARADHVQAGGAPTLRELIAIVKKAPLQ